MKTMPLPALPTVPSSSGQSPGPDCQQMTKVPREGRCPGALASLRGVSEGLRKAGQGGDLQDPLT